MEEPSPPRPAQRGSPDTVTIDDDENAEPDAIRRKLFNQRPVRLFLA
jgi:hypothetical protein